MKWKRILLLQCQTNMRAKQDGVKTWLHLLLRILLPNYCNHQETVMGDIHNGSFDFKRVFSSITGSSDSSVNDSYISKYVEPRALFMCTEREIHIISTNR